MRAPYVGAAIGMWYLAAPLIWGYPFGFLWWNDIVIGLAILAISGSFLAARSAFQGWLLIAVGAYSLFSPFLHSYLSQAFPLFNDIVFGVVTIGTGCAMGGAWLEYGAEKAEAG